MYEGYQGGRNSCKSLSHFSWLTSWRRLCGGCGTIVTGERPEITTDGCFQACQHKRFISCWSSKV